MTSTTSSPLVLRGFLGRRVRLRSAELLWETRAAVRRIPVAAVARVEVRGRGGRTLVVVLTEGREQDQDQGEGQGEGGDGGEEGTGGGPVTYTLHAYSAAATRLFADAVRGALPVRDADQPRPSGARLVTVERRPAPVRPRRIRPDVVAAVAFCLVLAALVVTASWAGAFAWVLVPLAGGAGVSLTSLGWKPAREGWILAVRGITVDGRRKNSGAVDAGDPDALYVYLFDDAEGVPRAYRGSNGGRDEEEIVYDPRNPAISQLRRRNAAQLCAGAAVLVLLALPLLAGGAALGLFALADLFHAAW
ncbi:hypothetical protein ABZ135_13305 [Streptomyces sp. NPDC006339]|uniref:hypothetical protein n=1 Tax=Streptomyces sp. NPDC006339 TaxID=3156755 RepID=UPI0033B7974C